MQPDANLQILVNEQLATGSQMPILNELATGNWQPEANSI